MPAPGALLPVGAAVPVIPGVYFEVFDAGASTLPGVTQGVVAVIARAQRGPIATPTAYSNADSIDADFGVEGSRTSSANRMQIAREALAAGASQALVTRYGTGGAIQTLTLQDTTGSPINVVRLDALTKGAIPMTATIRAHPTITTMRQLVIQPTGYAAEVFSFLNNATDGTTGEPQSLVNAVAAAGSNWITATKLADGNKILAPAAAAAFTGGTDPTIDGAALTAALNALAPLQWNALIVDAEDTTTFTTILSFLQAQEQAGRRHYAVVGEPESVSIATRAADARALNYYGMLYAGNAVPVNAVSLQGMDAAAVVAGMAVRDDVSQGLTGQVPPGGTRMLTGLSDADLTTMLSAGAVVFNPGRNGLPTIVQDLNTYTVTDGAHDAGWKHHIRVVTRYRAMDLVALSWAELLGQVRNNSVGRARIRAAAVTALSSMVVAGQLSAYSVIEDPDNPSVGSTAYYRISLDDADTIDTLIGLFGFRFSAPVA